MSVDYLIDTNIVLWTWHEPHRVSRKHREILASSARRYVSFASIWEINIKVSIGKLDTVENVAGALLDTGYVLLPIKLAHIEAVRHLPFHHREPVDRLIVAQAQCERLTLMTGDRQLAAYDVQLA